jgi:mRNA interferase MazF
MTRYKSGDIVLVRFPFTDLSTSKKRPALVLSSARFSAQQGDVVVMALTSQSQRDTQLRLAEWKAAGLPKPTWLKTVIGTLATSLVVRRLGRLGASDRKRVGLAVRKMMHPICFPDSQPCPTLFKSSGGFAVHCGMMASTTGISSSRSPTCSSSKWPTSAASHPEGLRLAYAPRLHRHRADRPLHRHLAQARQGARARRHLRRGAVALQEPARPQAAHRLIDETEWTALDALPVS